MAGCDQLAGGHQSKCYTMLQLMAARTLLSRTRACSLPCNAHTHPPLLLNTTTCTYTVGCQVAALEVEQIVKRLAAANDHTRIRAIIDKLISEYAFSPQANHRKV